MSYNLSFLNYNSTNLLILVQGADTALGGLVSTLLIVIIFFGSLAIFRSREFIDNWNISGFVTSILTTLAWFIGFVKWDVVMIPLSLMVLGLLVKFIGNR